MPLEGLQISHYRVLAKLGEGAFGTVYSAEDLKLGRRVALKLLSAARAADSRARERFRAEARAVAALDHPHICMLYELDEHDGDPILAMQLVEGETLGQALARGPLSEDRAREIMGAVASALVAAHARGVVHRDVKSENILLGRDGSIKLSDFGVARLAEAAGLTTAGAMVGTPAYLAPELISGCGAGEAADQFALAVVAYESLTGKLPFSGDSVAALLYAITNTNPQLPSRLRHGLSPDWDALLGRALAKEPSQRFGSMEEFARAVARTAPAGSSTFARRPAATRPRGGPSLAVLYFENLSNDPDSDYFCAGITEDILTDLSKVPGLKVTSRNAVARYRGQSVDIPLVAEELGVEAVLEGSVRRAGNRLRISAQLINAADGFHLWAERYDRTLDDVFAVQEDIARSIAAALRGALTKEEAKELMRTRPAGVEAYDLYLKGREFYSHFTLADNRLALECFEQALAVDPDYALAWAGVADCCAQMRDNAWDTDSAWTGRGLEAGERAVTLDPSLPEAHKSLALACLDSAHAVTSLRRALELNPSFAPALVNLGFIYMAGGELAGAEKCARRSISADPHSAWGYGLLARVFLHTRRYRECVEQLHHWQRLGANTFYRISAYAMRAWALAYLGDLPAAEGEIRETRALGLKAPYVDGAEALVAAMGGQTERARAIIAQVELTRPNEMLEESFIPLAEAAACLGDAPVAVRILRSFEQIRPMYQSPWYYRIAPGLSRIREAPEFREWIGERGRRIVWPLEAPPLPPEDRAQFTDYSEASGSPQGDEIL